MGVESVALNDLKVKSITAGTIIVSTETYLKCT
jgi:hypothetical protein